MKALQKWRFRVVPGEGKGSHVKLRFKAKNPGEVRTVIVPDPDELSTGTLQDIADQAGANDFQEFLEAIDELV